MPLGELFSESRRELVLDALLACGAMQTLDARHAVVARLPAHVGQYVREDAVPRTHAEAILDRCCEHAPGGLDALVDQIRRIDGSTIAVLDLEHAVAEARSRIPLSRARWARLHSFADEIMLELDDLASAWKKAVTNHFFGPTPASVALAFSQMPNFTISQVLEFLTRVALLIPHPGPLLTWLDEAAGELDDAAPELRARNALARIRHRLENEQDEPVVLVIELWPEPWGSEEFVLRAWTAQGEGALREISVPQKAVAATAHETFATLPAVVNRLLAEVQQIASQISVELIVPQYLLHREYEHWQVNVGRLRPRLGTEYPVVLRSLDRLTLKRPQLRRWRAKWQLVLDANYGANNPASFWLRRSDDSEQCTTFQVRKRYDDGTYEDLHEHDAIAVYTTLSADDAGAWVCLEFDPPCGAAENDVEADVLDSIVTAGTPIVVWRRTGMQACADAHTVLEALISDGAPAHLPRVVLNARKAAFITQDERADGRHIALVYDDPSRAPLQLGMAPPSGGR